MKFGKGIYTSGKKSQSSLLVLVSVIAILGVAWVGNIFSQQTDLSRIIESAGLTKLVKFLDVLKGVSRNSLILSAHRGTFFVAGKGESYICNGPTPPAIDEIRFELTNASLDTLNSYVAHINFTEATLSFNMSNFTCVDFPMNDAALNSGIFDENFSVGAYGSVIQISSEENNASSKNSISEKITMNRFWFLYRKFRDWSYKMSLTDDVCNCLCPQNVCSGCADASLESSRRLLEQTINDPEVECYVQKTCCHEEKVDYSGEYYSSCVEWPEAPCAVCSLDRHSDICTEKTPFSSIHEQQIENQSNESNIEVTNESSSSALGSGNYKEARGTVKATFSCIDKKYQLSLPAGSRNLLFSVDATVFLRTLCPEEPPVVSPLFPKTSPLFPKTSPLFPKTDPLFPKTSSPLFPKTSSPLFPKTSSPLFPKTSSPLFPKTDPLFPKTSSPLFPKTSSPLFPKTSSPLFPKTSSPLFPKTDPLFPKTSSPLFPKTDPLFPKTAG
jgi:hypothetical protein